MKMKHVFALMLVAALIFAAGCGPSRDVDTLLKEAAAENAAGRPEEALALAKKAVSQDSKRTDALIFEAVMFEKTGKLDAAVEAAKKAVELEPESFAAQYTLGRLYSIRRETWTDALTALGKAIAIRPGDRDTLILLANVTMSLHPDQAKSYLFALARDSRLRSSAEYQNQLGILLARSNTPKAAGEAFLAGCRVPGASPVISFNLARCIDLYLNNPRSAAALYRRYLDLAPGDEVNAELRRVAEARMRAIQRR